MPIEINQETYLSTKEACNYLGVSRETLNNMVQDGSLQKYKQGFARTVYYKQTELDNLRNMRKIDDGASKE